MQPAVSRLETTYGDDIAFHSIDAQNAPGSTWFAQLALPGHPGYVVFDANGNEVFRTFGVVEQAVLEAQLQPLLSQHTPDGA